ncbi:MAG: MTH1187 family thiamine-binding protein [Promethearchaeota archaeon]
MVWTTRKRVPSLVIVSFDIVPIGTEATSVSEFVAEAIKAIKEFKDLKFTLTPMCTILEGSLDHVMTAIMKAHEAVFKAGAERVVTNIKIDDRRDVQRRMGDKVKAVEDKL